MYTIYWSLKYNKILGICFVSFVDEPYLIILILGLIIFCFFFITYLFAAAYTYNSYKQIQVIILKNE